VAERLRQRNHIIKAGDQIPFVITRIRRKNPQINENEGKISSGGKGYDRELTWAERARHPSELVGNIIGCRATYGPGSASSPPPPSKSGNEKLASVAEYEIDLDWYLAQQIHPAIMRLC
jgi:DNA polymerase elongation subunit (family B)